MAGKTAPRVTRRRLLLATAALTTAATTAGWPATAAIADLVAGHDFSRRRSEVIARVDGGR